MNNFPYKYYRYGSDDSQDVDILISIPKEDMPIIQEDRKRFVKKLTTDYNLEYWNSNLIVIENGIVVDTIYPKTWIDSINNSLFYTYHLHEQKYPLPIIKNVQRNKLLAIFKTVRTVLSMLTRTEYRSIVKIALNSKIFNDKIKILSSIDFTRIENFKQTNMKDEDIWKVIAFYISQNIALVNDNIEIYTKKDMLNYSENLYPFLYRKEITIDLKYHLNDIIKTYIDIISEYDYVIDDDILSCNGEYINIKNEIF